jgi:hypothetical protein
MFCFDKSQRNLERIIPNLKPGTSLLDVVFAYVFPEEDFVEGSSGEDLGQKGANSISQSLTSGYAIIKNLSFTNNIFTMSVSDNMSTPLKTSSAAGSLSSPSHKRTSMFNKAANHTDHDDKPETDKRPLPTETELLNPSIDDEHDDDYGTYILSP